MSSFLPIENADPNEIGDILFPYQRKWLALPNQIKLCTKSRRIGISWAEACSSVLTAVSDTGKNAYYISYEKEMTRQFIEDCSNWAKAFKFAASEIQQDVEVVDEKEIQVFRIHFNSGNKIETLSSKPRNIRSKKGKLTIDEAAFLDDLPGVLKAAKALRVWGGIITVITTYNGIDNDYYNLEQEVVAGKLPYGRILIDFNMAVKDGLFKRICKLNGEKWTKAKQETWYEEILAEFGADADEELFCIPRESSGNYFSRNLVLHAMQSGIKILKLSFKNEFSLWPEVRRREEVDIWLRENIDSLLLELHPFYKTFYGLDVARVGDLTYLIIFQEQPNLVKKTAFALELSNVPFAQQKQILFHIADRLPRFIGGAHDARGIGHDLAESAADRYGHYRIAQIQISDKFYDENFPKYRASLEDKMVILPSDADLLDDHRMVEIINGIPKIPAQKRQKGTDGKQRHGDGAIACLLAHFASEMDFEDAMPAQPSQEFSWW